jgi:integrase
MLQSHLQWLQTSRNNHTSSLRRKIASLKGLFRHAQASGWLAADPAATLIYPPPHRPSIVALRPAEEAAAVAAASDPLWQALVLLFLDCGLKRDEVLALRAEDVLLGPHAESSLISVRRADRAQRARARSLRVTERLHHALSSLLTTPLPGRQVVDLSVRGVNFVVETIGHRAGLTRIPTLTPEILRDTFAVQSMAAYVELERRLVDERRTPRTLAKARAQHDQELLQSLGLSRQSDGPARYRRAAEEWLAEATGAARGET